MGYSSNKLFLIAKGNAKTNNIQWRIKSTGNSDNTGYSQLKTGVGLHEVNPKQEYKA